jgi:hypothetical protein
MTTIQPGSVPDPQPAKGLYIVERRISALGRALRPDRDRGISAPYSRVTHRLRSALSVSDRIQLSALELPIDSIDAHRTTVASARASKPMDRSGSSSVSATNKKPALPAR